ncbi:MAG: phasin family protein, partial [Sinobacteraceae bacterium]|nr:phasin family protein [Nevskiaceae bacterium]
MTMVAKSTLDKVRGRIERLRKDSLATATEANKIVYNGVQRIADNELKALNDTYKTTINQLQKNARLKGSKKDMVADQIDVLQETANRVIASAREAVKVMEDTRKELLKLMKRSGADSKAATKQAKQITDRARKAATQANT